jgi:hypothetical protein
MLTNFAHRQFALHQWQRPKFHYTGQMLAQLAISTLMGIITVVIHGLGLNLLTRMVRKEFHEEKVHHISSLSARSMFFIVGLVLGLFLLHGFEIRLYAFLFIGLGAIKPLETAVYFSTISYAGIGYDDRYIEPAWRLVSAIEGINGLLLLGWSTAFFFTLVTRLGR